ncbi:aquaporin-9 [Parasteatoda tepidariorum]|uniref:aquaporin-9 n=1 Tax=Parasteatoda tepidariorum TaxID=114398 RepID=UPI001C727A50|nr:aquaporin-9 [Parasteatoda tepidariorum]XP_042906417.1 aquaporin-9 [Parasteatoda tepidariorum]XP_042906418.1 aquaporin-9 [Parasteatoda tepidariorum]
MAEDKIPTTSNKVNLRIRHMETLMPPTEEEILNGELRKLALKNDMLKESISEFFATFLLVFLGDCVIATLMFARADNVGLAAAPLGWGLALMVAVAVTGRASGCHANPAVTLAFATVGKIKLNRVLPYFLAQYLGALTAAVLVFAVYYDSIGDFDGGERLVPPHLNATAQIFATYPPPHVSLWAAFVDQVIATAILLMAVVAIIDPKNLSTHKGLYPLLIGLALGAIVYALPYNCMAPLNPARDLSPRLFTLMAGYGLEVFSHRNYGYFIIPIIAPHIGAVIGVWLYKLAIEIHLPENKSSTGAFRMRETSEESENLDEDPKEPLIHIER